MGVMQDLYEFARQQIGKDPGRAFDALFYQIEELAAAERLSEENPASETEPPPKSENPWPEFGKGLSDSPSDEE